MRVTIVPDDQIVIVNGSARRFEFTIDEDIHAVQWHEDHGFIEYKSATERKYIDNFGDFSDILDLYEAAGTPEPEEEGE